MIMFPDMIAEAAEEAGIKLPHDLEEYNPEEFPHWHVYQNVQLCRAVTWGNHWENAKIIAKIPKENLKKITENDLREMGFSP
jgi:signal recognition particle subunit SEC65